MRRSRVMGLAIVGIFLAALSACQLYKIAVYDACLDGIDYDRSRQHLCDADPTKIYPRTPE